MANFIGLKCCHPQQSSSTPHSALGQNPKQGWYKNYKEITWKTMVNDSHGETLWTQLNVLSACIGILMMRIFTALLVAARKKKDIPMVILVNVTTWIKTSLFTGKLCSEAHILSTLISALPESRNRKLFRIRATQKINVYSEEVSSTVLLSG